MLQKIIKCLILQEKQIPKEFKIIKSIIINHANFFRFFIQILKMKNL